MKKKSTREDIKLNRVDIWMRFDLMIYLCFVKEEERNTRKQKEESVISCVYNKMNIRRGHYSNYSSAIERSCWTCAIFFCILICVRFD